MPKFNAMALSRDQTTIRNEEECVDALVRALEAVYPDLEVTVLVLRLIAKFVHYRTLLDGRRAVRVRRTASGHRTSKSPFRAPRQRERR